MRYQLVLTLLIAFATASQGAVIQFSSRAAFGAAAPTTTTIDFSGQAGVGEFLNVTSGITLSGVAFSPTGGSLLYIADRDVAGYDFGAPATLNPQLGGPSGFQALLPSGTTAVGTDLTGFLGDAVDFDIFITTASGTQQFGFTGSTYPPLGFAGFTSTESILSVQFSSAINDQSYANFTFGQQVPEPGSLLLLASGGLVLLVARKRLLRRV